MSEDRYLTLEETAAYLGLSRNTLFNWVYLKKMPFPFTKVGQQYRVKKSEIEKYLEKRTIKQY